VFQFAEPQHRDGLDDLPFSLSNSTSMISSFAAPCGFYSKAYSKCLEWNIVKIWEQWMHRV
jgi:hypothetical protein